MPLTEPFELPSACYKIVPTPYTLWLGDGSAAARLSYLGERIDSMRNRMASLGWREVYVSEKKGSAAPPPPPIKRRFWIRTFEHLTQPQMTELTDRHRAYAAHLRARGRFASEEEEADRSDLMVPAPPPGNFMLATRSERLHHHDRQPRRRVPISGLAIGDVIRLAVGDGDGGAVTLAHALSWPPPDDDVADRGRRAALWRERLSEDVRALHAAGVAWGSVTMDSVLVRGDDLWIMHLGVGPKEPSPRRDERLRQLDEEQWSDRAALEVLMQSPSWYVYGRPPMSRPSAAAAAAAVDAPNAHLTPAVAAAAAAAAAAAEVVVRRRTWLQAQGFFTLTRSHVMGRTFKETLYTENREWKLGGPPPDETAAGRRTRELLRGKGWHEFDVVERRPGTDAMTTTHLLVRLLIANSPTEAANLVGKHHTYNNLHAQRLNLLGRPPDELLRRPGVVMFASPGPYSVPSCYGSHLQVDRVFGIAMTDRVGRRGGARTLGQALAESHEAECVPGVTPEARDEHAGWRGGLMEALRRETDLLHREATVWGSVDPDSVLVQGSELWVYHFGIDDWHGDTAMTRERIQGSRRMRVDVANIDVLVGAYLVYEDDTQVEGETGW